MLDWKSFRKPQRYLGNETNVVKKSHHGKIKICLCFPDLYEVGMSNLGLRIIYGYFNEFDDVLCERVFMPDLDLYDYLKQSQTTLFSLETKTALNEFDVFGVNLSCELTYTNFLAILDSGGIELKASKRRDTIVIAGHTGNPEPMTDFVDVFFLGEFEESIPQFLDVLRKVSSKEERLKALSQIEGFYVPSFYQIIDGGKKIEKVYSYAKFPLTTVSIKDLDSSYFPRHWLTPHTQIIHDRAQVEIARGCPNPCAFCQARCSYYPYRERSPGRILEIMKDIYKYSGYENFSLLSLSASNHSRIEEIVSSAADYFAKFKVGISLPSLRIEDAVENMHTVLSKIKKVSLTFAVEAATDTLRKSLNKNIDIQKLFDTARIMKKNGSRQIKLYFMFGLPHETDGDLEAIGDFVMRLHRYTSLKINLSINAFIPKPFSYFENSLMLDQEELSRRKRIILRNIPRNKAIQISISNIKKSYLEAIVSRADRSFGKVIYEAFKRGALLDAYDERTNYLAWEEAQAACGCDAGRFIQPSAVNSWKHLKSRDPRLQQQRTES